MRGFIPYLIVRDAEQAIEFYAKAFGGEIGLVLKMNSGEVGHAEVIEGVLYAQFSEGGVA